MNNSIYKIPKLDSMTIVWMKHSLQRMFERNITRANVKMAISEGIIIEQYPDDYPHPSCLVAYIKLDMALHVVFSIDNETNTLYVITAYKPDNTHFENDLITRK